MENGVSGVESGYRGVLRGVAMSAEGLKRTVAGEGTVTVAVTGGR